MFEAVTLTERQVKRVHRGAHGQYQEEEAKKCETEGEGQAEEAGEEEVEGKDAKQY